VPYQLPDGSIKPHMALVQSTEKLQLAEDGMFYAVLISSKNHSPKYTLQLKDERLTRPMPKHSYFVTHFMTYFSPDEVTQSYRTSVKSKYMDVILCKVAKSIFELDIDIE